MNFISRITKPFLNAVILIAMAALWILFAPTQFGGTASYVMIAGASMEPTLRWGDLVITQQEEQYREGDIVTYQHPIVGPVIHRILDASSDGYILKGDNNDWIDSYQPVEAEIVGKAWLQIPSAARVLYQLRTPLGLTLLSIFLGVMFLVTLATRDSSDESAESKMKKKAIKVESLIGVSEAWLFPLATVLLASVLLGLYSFSRPMYKLVQEDIPYEHQGKFRYLATGNPDIYDFGRIETGDPIFHSLASSFDLTFEYAFHSTAIATSKGSYRLVLEVSEPNGWRRQTELVPSTPYSQNSFSVSSTVDLDLIRAWIEELETRTGFKRLPFDVRIIPSVQSEASVAGHPFVEEFTPSLHFKLDDYQLYLDGSNPFDDEQNPLEPVARGLQPDFQSVPNKLNLLGLEIPVETARWIAAVSFTLSVLGLGIVLIPIFQRWREGEIGRIALQYPEILLDVDKLPKLKEPETIDVTSFDDLAKLANANDGMVLHHGAHNKHTYILQTDTHIYRYVLLEEEQEEQE